jgi:hypothetical protein
MVEVYNLQAQLQITYIITVELQLMKGLRSKDGV